MQPVIKRGLLVVLAMVPLFAEAQFESPILSKIQLNLVNPGGKSMAMGGAFVSIADDATAAFANPAGLPQLGAWQAGVSGKLFVANPLLRAPEYYGSGRPLTYEYLGDRLESEPGGQATDLEFLSVVGPIAPNISMAAYRAVNLRYRIDTARHGFEDFRAFLINQESTYYLSLDEQGEIDIQNEVYGLSLGARFGPVSVGGGVTLNKLRYELSGAGSSGEHLFIVNASNTLGSGAGAPYTTRVTTDVDSSPRFGGIFGIRADIDEARRISLGAVYRRGASFDVGYSVKANLNKGGASLADFSCGRDDPRIPGSGASACGTFRVPDDFSFGMSGRPTDRLLFSVDVQWVLYSQLNEGYVPLFVYCQKAAVSPCPAENRAVSKGTASDGTLVRFGAEYALTYSREREIVMRAGYYLEPAHGMKVDLYPDADRDRRPDDGPPIEVSEPPFSDAYRRTFDGGTAENHFSFGVGVRLGRSFSIDLAADIGKSNQYAVLSAFYRFR